ncbi:MAG: hypothetical protein GF333_00150, partial [Candidatus Omnitrophica bacterium]|nr:hypothetical protein [Candidatus Omnitrophota bacterium]
MNHFVFSASVTTVTTFLLGVYVLFSYFPTKKKLYLIYSFYSLSISFWAFFVSFFNADFRDPSLIFGRLLHLGAILIPILFVHFVLEFLELRKKVLLFVIYAFGGVFIYLVFFTKLLITGVTRRSVYSYPSAGPLYLPFFIFFVSLIVIGILLLFIHMRRARGNRKNQIKYLLFGSILGYSGGLKNFLVVADIEIFPIYPYGTYAIPVYVFIVAYAILRYRLLDIKIAVTRAGLFIVVYAFILGLPFWMGYATQQWPLSLAVMAV